MLTQDSIHIEPIATDGITEGISDSTVQNNSIPQTPYQVLRLLPKDATPAQQDSAIQAWFQPGEIHYSDRPDTLHLPGHDAGRNLTEVNLPQYYRESYFSNDSLYHPELDAQRFGMAGDPRPYTMRDDNIISSLMLACFILTLIAFSASKQFLLQQAKDFFYIPKATKAVSETSTEIVVQLFLLMQTCLLLTLFYFFYIRKFVASTFILSDEYLMICILFGVTAGYFVLKFLVYSAVNAVFFDSKSSIHFSKAFLFTYAAEGILLFPAIILLVFFNLDSQAIIIFTIIIVVLVKIMTFYKTYVIFFRQKALYLQNILYFCTLEIVPLIALWGGLTAIVNVLKINY